MKKIQEVIQDKHNNLSQILHCLTKVLLQYTNQDPEIPDIKQQIRQTDKLMIYFFQNFADIRAKLECLENRTLIP